jgi:D-alanyl-D-alanine carboxypeptidase
LAAAFLGLSGYLYFLLTEETGAFRFELATSNERIDGLLAELASTTDRLMMAEADRDLLSESLEEEVERNEEFEDQIREISGTVGLLDKLAKTDPELLQKYSRVFFLNEHYMPERLSEIDDAYVFREEPEFLHRNVMPFFEDMLEDAEEDDIHLQVISAFRSFDEQADLKGNYLVTYGSGSNTFSADQGYSEHQLGTTIDFTTEGLNGGLQGFDTTAAYEWLLENAHKYGFVLSYPPDNQYYVFEPWHWRFVGEDLARDMHEDGDYFYDLEQREINEYLISIFD